MNVFASEQQIVEARLDDNAFFEDIAIVVEDQGDPEVKSEKVQATRAVLAKLEKTGLAVLILTPAGRQVHPDSDVGSITLQTTVSIYENWPVNNGSVGTGKSGLTVLQNVFRLLNRHRPGRGAAPFVFVEFESEETGPLVIHHARFERDVIIDELAE